MISAASIRSPSSSPPAICPDRPDLLRLDVGVAQLARARVASSTREASARTAFQRSDPEA